MPWRGRMKTFHRRDCVFTYLQLHMKEMSDILTSWIKSLTFSIASIIERIHIFKHIFKRREGSKFWHFHCRHYWGLSTLLHARKLHRCEDGIVFLFPFQKLSFNQSCFVSNCQLLQIDFFHTKVFRMLISILFFFKNTFCKVLSVNNFHLFKNIAKSIPFI